MRALQTLRTMPRDDFLRRVARRFLRPGLFGRLRRKLLSGMPVVRLRRSRSYLAARVSRGRLPRDADTLLALDAGQQIAFVT